MTNCPICNRSTEAEGVWCDSCYWEWDELPSDSLLIAEWAANRAREFERGAAVEWIQTRINDGYGRVGHLDTWQIVDSLRGGIARGEHQKKGCREEMSKPMEYEPCYICGQETEDFSMCKNCTDEITKLHTEFHTFQVDFDEVVIKLYRAQRKIESLELELETLGANALKAMELKDEEIERLKYEDELTKWKLKVRVVAREGERFGPWSYVNVKVDDVGYADKVAVLSPGESLVRISELHEAQAEVERLKAHIWEQEREAVVAWLNRSNPAKHSLKDRGYPSPGYDAERIERGEHWPKDGESK